jgi:hypothetical protein
LKIQPVITLRLLTLFILIDSILIFFNRIFFSTMFVNTFWSKAYGPNLPSRHLPKEIIAPTAQADTLIFNLLGDIDGHFVGSSRCGRGGAKIHFSGLTETVSHNSDLSDRTKGGCMKAAVMKKKGLVEVEEIEIPVPNEDQVRIAVQLAGICGSDNSIFHGKIDAPFPLIPGHEAVGVIDAVGTAVTRFKPGQRVTIHPNYACGHCSTCVKGMPNICRNKIRLGVDINGVFADYVVVPQKAVLPVPDSLPNEIAALAEPLAVTVHATHQVDITPDSRVLIFGAGVMGQLTLQLALQHTKDVTACDLMEPRLALATQMGARNVIGAKIGRAHV